MIEVAKQTEGSLACERTPLVSVIIPAYNAAASIKRGLDSVINQSRNDFEIIVINDGSPDTAQLEEALRPYEGSIIYLRQENRGAAAARNTGLKLAKGELVAFLDADDYWLPDYLDKQIDVLLKSGADVVYCDALLVGASNLAGRTYMEMAPSRCAVTPESLLAVDVGVITSGVIAHKKLIYEVGLFDEGIRRGHDFDLWLRLAQKGASFACHPEVLLHYEVSGSGLSGNVISQLERRVELLGKIRTRGLTATEETALSRNLNECTARLALEKGRAKLLEKDFSGALTSFNEARKLRPNWKLSLACFGLRLAPELFWHVYRTRSTAAF